MWHSLRGDRLSQLAVVALAAVIAPYFLPGLPREQVQTYARFFSDVPLILLALASFQLGLRRVDSFSERQFWHLWTAALGAWFLQRMLRLFVAADLPVKDPRIGLIEDVFYLCLYLFVALALETEPHRSHHPGVRSGLRWLESAGAIVFMFAMLVYFAFIPMATNADLYTTAVPSLLLYVALDTLVILKLLGCLLGGTDERWRRIYGLMLGTTLLWMLTDTIELLMAAEILPWVAEGTAFDLLWIAPFPLLIAAGRIRQHHVTSQKAKKASVALPRFVEGSWGGPPMLHAVTLPFFHFSLYALGVLDPVSKAAREVCVLVAITILAAMAFALRKLLERENQRLEAERSVAAEALRRSERMTAVGVLVAGVAHEVRNPLFGMSATLDAFEKRLGEDERARQYIEHLRQELDRLSNLMKDLLDYARAPKLELVEAGVQEAIAGAVEACEPLAEREAMKIELQVAEGLPNIKLDAGRLRQVFVNLVENAIQHSPAGSVVRIGASMGSDCGRPCIECVVSDDGAGFEDADLSQVFEPFFTQRVGGTGLGLSIVRRIVEEHGGDIQASNLPAGGARVVIRLPVGLAVAEGSGAVRSRVA